jgi:hypothetical protein
MRIKDGGNVGIGTTNPTHNLHIASTEDAAIFLEADTDNDNAAGEDHQAFIKLTQDNSANIAYLGTIGDANKTPENDASTDILQNSLYLGYKTAHPLHLVTNNVARMTILSDGKIGVNTNAPAWAGIHIDNGHLGIDNGVSDGRIGFHINDRIDNYTVIQDDETTAATAEKIAHYGLTRPSTAIEDPIILSGYFGLEFATNGLKRIRINNNGNVGIGHPFKKDNTNNSDVPTVPLDVGGKIGVSRFGLLGSYDQGATEVQGIWSIGKSYPIDTTANDFGTAYGIAYGHSNAGADGTAYLGFTGQHQILFVENGTPKAAIGLDGQAYFNKKVHSLGEFMSETGADSGAYMMGGRNDLGTESDNYQIQMMAPNHVIMMIDSNANEDTAKFKIKKHSETVDGGTELLNVDQDGLMTFSSADSGITFASTNAPTNGYISFPLLSDASANTFRTALRFPSTDDRALIQYGTVSNDDFELRLRLQDGNADKFVIISDSSNDYRALDINGNRAAFFADNQSGKVGIGTTSPTNELHISSTSTAAIKLDANTNESGTNQNPFIILLRNETADPYESIIGITDEAGKLPDGRDANNDGDFTPFENSLIIGSMYPDENRQHSYLHLMTAGRARMTFLKDSLCVAIGMDQPSNIHDANGSSLWTSDGNNAKPLLLLKSQHEGSNADGDTGGGIRFADNDSEEYWDNANIDGVLHWSFGSGGTATKQFYANTDSTEEIIAFTGQHPCRPTSGEVVDYSDKVGYIVVADGTYNNGFFSTDVNDKSTPSINEALPHVKLSTKEKEKSVFGVISNAEDLNNINSPVWKDENSPKPYREWTNGKITSFLRYEEGDERIWINSLGEGAVMVCNMNGNLENGDYITTSAIEGLGMKQDDDLLHNYTVAKVTQDVTFLYGDPDVKEITYQGQTYKAKLVGCTYHCG